MCPCKGDVDVCPVTKESWEARANRFNCGFEEVYHCLADSEGHKWENCVQKTLISEGKIKNKLFKVDEVTTKIFHSK